MTFKSAHEKLKTIAAGRYFSMSYDLSTFSSGRMEQRCLIYIDKNISGTGDTWESAFTKLHAEMYPDGNADDAIVVDDFREIDEPGGK